jgi:hypothetical protein
VSLIFVVSYRSLCKCVESSFVVTGGVLCRSVLSYELSTMFCSVLVISLVDCVFLSSVCYSTPNSGTHNQPNPSQMFLRSVCYSTLYIYIYTYISQNITPDDGAI